jgi:hypothetical protein
MYSFPVAHASFVCSECARTNSRHDEWRGAAARAAHHLILIDPLHADKTVSKASRRDPSLDDPRPTPPTQPELEDCCRSGGTPCVFDLYDEALARYEAALAAWEARHASGKARR